jgi:beta-lactam-binding protein with PASTA domain
MPLISDSIGRVLGKRYRLLSALGTGASAHVFLAEDVSLQRHVAVKVLQPALASDEAFLKRFGAEARSVASLNHPHVLRVFDWGEDSDGPYLVLEYLGGGSLRDLLDRGVRLSHSQAARLGTEVAQGLAYAHARGLVHRDIKPANLLFDEEGRVRVADFGVARALAEAAWTEPEGAMIGTARYISPESAEGKTVDGRADVYSLALVLYEAVSGTVPFVADTTMGTLMARVGSPLPPHEALGPLDDVLARAAAPEASARLDAAGFAARLGALASALPNPEPLPLHPPDHQALAPISGFRAPPVSELTAVATPTVGGGGGGGGGASGSATAVTAAGAPVGTRAGPGEIFDAEPGGGRTRSDDYETVVGAAAVGGAAGGAVAVIKRRPGGRRRAWIIGAVAAVLVLIAASVAAIEGKVFTPSHPSPNLVGLSLTAARTAAAKDHFSLHAEPAIKSTSVLVPGTIISQTPKPGTVLKQGSVLTVVPSLGPPSEPVASLAGLTCASAEAALTPEHLTGVCATAQYSDTVPNSQLISWSYGSVTNPTTAPYGSTIQLVPSRGHAPVTVPSTITSSDTFAEAQAALQAVGLTATQANAPSPSVQSGYVISTTPAAGQPAPYGSAVTVTVSSGPPTVQVPNVFQDTVAQATAALQQAGLTVSGAFGPNANSSTSQVIYTNPGQGTTVNEGSSVALYTN